MYIYIYILTFVTGGGQRETERETETETETDRERDRERDREKSVRLQRCIAFSAAALRKLQSSFLLKEWLKELLQQEKGCVP